MEENIIIITNNQSELINELKTLVKLIGKSNNYKSYSLYMSKYYNLIYSNFKDIEYFVSKFSNSYLDEFIIDDIWINN